MLTSNVLYDMLPLLMNLQENKLTWFKSLGVSNTNKAVVVHFSLEKQKHHKSVDDK